MSLSKLMRRVSPCKSLRNIYVYAFPSFNSFKYSPPYLQGTNFRGQGRNMYIPAEPTSNPLQLKANPGNPVEVWSSDIEARPAMNAPPTNAFPGITDLKTKNKVEEAKGGLQHDVMLQTKKETEKMEWLARINRGRVIDINDLLFTHKRDYLIRNNGRQVKAEELEDKIIAVYLVPLLADSVQERMATTHLIDTYNYILPHNVFEVVLVAYVTDLETLHSGSQTNPEKQFEAIFSRMPWTAIPFSDITSRERLHRRYKTGRTGNFLDSFVVDPTGMVLQSSCLFKFETYGGLGYPFTMGRIEFLISQDDAIAEQPSLKMLLGSPERDYVISNKGDKVLIDSLEEKVVALYFYKEGCNISRRLREDIELAYEEFAEKEKDFEVVLIYLYDTEDTCGYASEESFCKTFKSMPWLALPFRDPAYRKLKRFFGHNQGEMAVPPSLVIIGPHAEFIEPWGADILMTHGLWAYPFTREKVAELVTEKLYELKLEMFWDRNTLFRRNDGTEVPFYELARRRIILFSEGKNLNNHATEFLELLKERYSRMRDMKGDYDEFEVIYITSSKEEAVYKDIIFDVPWLFALESELLPLDLNLYCCCSMPLPLCGCPCQPYCPCLPYWCGTNSTLLAFDKDGSLVRKSVHLDFDMADLFRDADLEEETLLELIEYYGWLEMDDEYSGLLINSLYKVSSSLSKL